jgi:hypothetical protein
MSKRSSAISSRTRVLLLASAAALVMTSFDAHAAPGAARSAAATGELAAAADTTEFGARKRSRRGGHAAGLAMMGMVVGTIGAVIAAQQRREAYEAAYNRAHAYYGHPYAYHPQPYVYHRPHVYYGYRGYDGQPPTPPLINGHRVGW